MSRVNAPRLTAFLLSLAFVTPIRADDPKPTPSSGQAGPTVSALSLAGEVVTGVLVGLDQAEGRIILRVDGADAPRSLALADLVKVWRADVKGELSGSGALLLLPDGDRLAVSIPGTKDDFLEVRSEPLGPLRIPLTAVVGWVLRQPLELSRRLALASQVRDEPRQGDMVWLVNGDRLTGRVASFSGRTLKLDVENAPREIDRSDVVAVGFDTGLTDYPATEKPGLAITLSDGSRLGVSKASLEGQSLVARSRFGAELRLPIRAVARMDIVSDSFRYLSDEDEAGVQYEEYVGSTLPYQRDRAIDGVPFRVLNRTYEIGLGTTGRTLLAYRLKEGDARFQAHVGLDDRAGPLGTATVRVLVDGEPRFESPPLVSGREPAFVDVDLAGGQLLILVTEFGPRGNVRDLVDWVEARVVQRP